MQSTSCPQFNDKDLKSVTQFTKKTFATSYHLQIMCVTKMQRNVVNQNDNNLHKQIPVQTLSSVKQARVQSTDIPSRLIWS